EIDALPHGPLAEVAAVGRNEDFLVHGGSPSLSVVGWSATVAPLREARPWLEAPPFARLRLLWFLPQWPEERPDLLSQHLGLLKGGEGAAFLEPRPAPDIAIHALGDRARR